MVVPLEDMCWRTVRDGMGWNFGRTDFKRSESKAKFYGRADGDVRLAVRRPKPRKFCEKQIDPKISRKNKIAPIFRGYFFGAPKKLSFEIFPRMLRVVF